MCALYCLHLVTAIDPKRIAAAQAESSPTATEDQNKPLTPEEIAETEEQVRRIRARLQDQDPVLPFNLENIGKFIMGAISAGATKEGENGKTPNLERMARFIFDNANTNDLTSSMFSGWTSNAGTAGFGLNKDVSNLINTNLDAQLIKRVSEQVTLSNKIH